MVTTLASWSRVTSRRGGIVAVDDLSLEIGAGEVVAVLGPNGAGKTTALEMLLGLVHPDAGVVRVLGVAPSVAIARGAVGAMLQDAGLPARATVEELVELARGLYPRPLPRKDVLGLCDIDHVAGRPVEALSGGEQQRVRLALSIAGAPELLVLDEPTAAMDAAARRSFWARARDYASEGRTALFSTHRLEEADEVADRVVVMSRGQLVADASPEEVKASIATSGAVSFAADGIRLELLERLPAVGGVAIARGRVTLRTVDPDRTLRALLERVPAVDGLEVTGARLEDAFLGLTEREQR